MNRAIHIIIGLCSAVFYSQFTHAQSNTSSNLAQLWEQVEDQYPGLKSKNALIDASDKQVKAIKSNGLPQLKIQAQNTYGTFEGSNGAFFPQPGFFNISGNSTNFEGSNQAMNTFSSTVVEWEIFNFGKQNQENKAANAQYLKTTADKDAYIISLKAELTKRYIEATYTLAKYNLVAKNTQRLNDIKTITSGLTIAGLKPTADSLIAYSSYLQSLGLQDNSLGQFEASKIRLAELMNTDKSTIQAVDLAQIKIPTSKVDESVFNETHPILEALDQQEAYLQHTANATQRMSLPSVKLMGGYAIRGSSISPSNYVTDKWKDGFSNSVDNYLVGVGLTWNFTSILTQKHKKDNYASQAKHITALKEEYEQRMLSQLESKQIELNEQVKQVLKTQQAVEHATSAYDMYVARYKSGLITLSELLQIQVLVEQAENTYVEASKQYWLQRIAEAELTTDFQPLFNTL